MAASKTKKVPDGHRLLDKWLKDSGTTAAALAKKLGWAPSHISMLRTGKAVPSAGRCKALQIATGGAVPADSWG